MHELSDWGQSAGDEIFGPTRGGQYQLWREVVNKLEIWDRYQVAYAHTHTQLIKVACTVYTFVEILIRPLV